MRTLIVSTFLTLDGVMQAPGGPEEDQSGGFTHGGWSVNYWDERMGEVMGEAMSAGFDLLLGRRPTTSSLPSGHTHRRPRRQAAERRDQVRRVAESARARVEQLGAARGGRGRRRRGAQAGGRARSCRCTAAAT